jgi:hypothetical protein
MKQALRKESRDMTTWLRMLKGDPLPWLLEAETPAVRHLALRQLLDRPEDAPEVRQAREAAMHTDPIASILAAQQPEGFWVKPGPGYTPKYRGTVWQLIFLDQFGADGTDARVQAACEYVLSHSQAATGGFACYEGGSREEAPPPRSLVIHCLNGNLLRALIGFGRLEDKRVQRAIDWQARSITGEGIMRYYRSGTSGPGFRCGSNKHLPCAWGAIKALLALARIPPHQRTSHVERAIEQGAAFLLRCDPASAAYLMGWGNVAPSPIWFKLGFPLGYAADLLQNLTVLCELGFARDRRLTGAVQWLLSQQEQSGRWRNESAYTGKTWVEMDKQGQPSKWVTLRVFRPQGGLQLAAAVGVADTMGSDSTWCLPKPSPFADTAESGRPLTRRQQAHDRLPWTQRLARHACPPWTPRAKSNLSGIPVALAASLGLVVAEEDHYEARCPLGRAWGNEISGNGELTG